MSDLAAMRLGAANKAALDHHNRRMGIEQRTPSRVRSDNNFVWIWLETYADAKNRKIIAESA